MNQSYRTAVSSNQQAASFSFDQQSSALRRLLRHLVETCHLGIGSRLLTIGCAGDAWRESLDYLGLDAVVVDKPQIQRPHADASFDLVVWRGIGDHPQSLVSLEPLSATAALLTEVKPGGYFVFLDETTTGGSIPDCIHNAGCIERHALSFPMQQAGVAFVSGKKQLLPLNRLRRNAENHVLRVVTIELSDTPITATEWSRLALSAAATSDASCCSASSAVEVEDRRGQHAA